MKRKKIYRIYKLYWVKLNFLTKNHRRNYKYKKLNESAGRIYLKIFFDYRDKIKFFKKFKGGYEGLI